MLTRDFYSSALFVLDSLAGIAILSFLLRFALFGADASRRKRLWLVLVAGGLVFASVAFDTIGDDFANLIITSPDPRKVGGWAVSFVIAVAFVWWRSGKPLPAPRFSSRLRLVLRCCAVLLSILLIVSYLEGVAVSAYRTFVKEAVSQTDTRSTMSRAKIREIMFNSAFGRFWKMLDQRAPDELDLVIESLFAQRETLRTRQEMSALIDQEMEHFHVSRFIYGAALSDKQRKNIIQMGTNLLKGLEDRPALCVDMIRTSGQSFSQQDLLSVQRAFNDLLIVRAESLLNAEQAATQNALVPVPATDADFDRLFEKLMAQGMSEEELMIYINQDTDHSDFCSIMITVSEEIVAMQGPSGKAIRFWVL